MTRYNFFTALKGLKIAQQWNTWTLANAVVKGDQLVHLYVMKWTANLLQPPPVSVSLILIS